jgi:putative flippase GtrA
MTDDLRRQFIRFGMVGVAGFLIDVGVLYMTLTLLSAGPYVGRGVSYLAAASSTWYLNRRFTFAARRSTAIGPEWLKFVLFNAAGGGLNYATYVVWLHYFGTSGLVPATGVGLGSLSGLCVNFTLSRQLVFRKPNSPVDDTSE